MELKDRAEGVLRYYRHVFQYLSELRFRVEIRQGEFVTLDVRKHRPALRKLVLPGLVGEWRAKPRPTLSLPPLVTGYLEDRAEPGDDTLTFGLGYPVVATEQQYLPLLTIPLCVEPEEDRLRISRLPEEIRVNHFALRRLGIQQTFEHYSTTMTDADLIADVYRRITSEKADEPLFELEEALRSKSLDVVRDRAIVYVYPDADFLWNVRQDTASILDWLKTSGPFAVAFGAPNENRPAGKRYGAVDARPLMPSQLQAALAIESRKLCSVSGPPGTGKTFLIGTLAAQKITARALRMAGLLPPSHVFADTLLITSTNRKAVTSALDKLRDPQEGKHIPGFLHAGRISILSESLAELAKLLKQVHEEPEEAARKEAARLYLELERLKSEIDRRAETKSAWTLPDPTLAPKIAAELDSIQGNSREALADVFTRYGFGNLGALLKPETNAATMLERTRKLVQQVADRTELPALHADLYRRAREYLYWHHAADKSGVRRMLALIDRMGRSGGLGYVMNQSALNLRTLYDFAPVILCTALSVRNILPMGVSKQPGEPVVDTAIVDEAAQTLFAFVLPVLYRAARVGVIGDTNQLGPVVSVPRDEIEALADKVMFGTVDGQVGPGEPFEYGRSALEVVGRRMKTAAVLREHFRCRREIISFCDRLCDYGLEIAIEVPPLPELPDPLVFVDVPGAHVRMGQSLANEAECEEVLKIAARLAERIGAERIAVLTPYRAQASLLRTRLRKAKLRMIAGTVHALQGDEKPVVIFSSVVSQRGPGSFAFVNRSPNLINVTVSRARQCLIWVGDRGKIEAESLTTPVGLLWRHFQQTGAAAAI